MTTLFLEWGGDLIVNQLGGLQLAVGWDEVRQRIIRRCLTNPKFKLQSGRDVPAGYIFHTDYGVGMRSMVDELITKSLIVLLEKKVHQGVKIDQGVDATAAPTIEIRSPIVNTLQVAISVRLKNESFGKIAFTLG